MKYIATVATPATPPDSLPVDRQLACPERARLGELEPESLEPGGLGAGVAAIEGVARCSETC